MVQPHWPTSREAHQSIKTCTQKTLKKIPKFHHDISNVHGAGKIQLIEAPLVKIQQACKTSYAGVAFGGRRAKPAKPE